MRDSLVVGLARSALEHAVLSYQGVYWLRGHELNAKFKHRHYLFPVALVIGVVLVAGIGAVVLGLKKSVS